MCAPQTYVYYGYGSRTAAGFKFAHNFSAETDGPKACPPGARSTFYREWDDGDVTAPRRSCARAGVWADAHRAAGIVLKNYGYKGRESPWLLFPAPHPRTCTHHARTHPPRRETLGKLHGPRMHSRLRLHDGQVERQAAAGGVHLRVSAAPGVPDAPPHNAAPHTIKQGAVSEHPIGSGRATITPTCEAVQ